MKRFTLCVMLIACLIITLPCFAGDRDPGKKAASAASSRPAPVSADSDAGKTNVSKPVYKIQIMALCCPLPMQASVFRRLGKVKVSESVFNNQYIYTVGEYKSRERAEEGLCRLKKGYSNAFVVEFVNGSRVRAFLD